MDQDLNYLDATIADLEARRDHLNTMIDGLRQLREQGPSPLPAGGVGISQGGSRHEKDIRHDSFFGMTLLEGIKKYLGMVKATKSAPDIAKALSTGGMKSAAKSFTGNVRTTLSKNDEFVKVNGEWGLAEWYPAMRKKARSNESEPEAAKTKESAPSPKNVSPDSLAGRVLQLLNSNPTQMFSCPDIASQLGANAPSVAAALSAFTKHEMIERPQKGRYRAKRKA